MWPVPEGQLPLFTTDYLRAISNGELPWTCECPEGHCICNVAIPYRPTGR